MSGSGRADKILPQASHQTDLRRLMKTQETALLNRANISTKSELKQSELKQKETCLPLPVSHQYHDVSVWHAGLENPE